MSGKENKKSDEQLDEENRRMEAQLQRVRDEIRDLDRMSEEKLRSIQEMYQQIQELEARLQAAKKK